MLLDKLTQLSPQQPFSATGRSNYVAQNNKRSRICKVRVTATVTVTVAGTLVRNNGSVLALISSIGLSQGSLDQVNFDARLLRHLSEFFASASVPCVRLTAAQAAAKAAYNLSEEVYLNLAMPTSANRSETYFKEQNPQNQLAVFIQQAPAAATAQLTDATVTVTNLTADVLQIFDENVSNLPLFVPYMDMVQLPITGAITLGKIDLRASDYLAAIIVMGDSNLGEQQDIINALAYRGDGVDIVGPNQVPFFDLVDAMASESGGAGQVQQGPDFPAGTVKSWWGYNHIKDGRLSALVPPNQIPNLRLEVNAQPSVVAGVTSSWVQVGRVMYRRDPLVCAPKIPFPVTA